MSKELDTIRDALELALDLSSNSAANKRYKSALAALSTIDPDAIRRECAERAVKFLNTFERDWISINGNVYAKHEVQLCAAILGTELAREES